MSFQIILIFHVILAIALVSIILIQQGKGADIGASFGAGASKNIFGARGANSFIYKLTFWLAFIFFLTSISLAYLASSEKSSSSEDSIVVEYTQPEETATTQKEQ